MRTSGDHGTGRGTSYLQYVLPCLTYCSVLSEGYFSYSTYIRTYLSSVSGSTTRRPITNSYPRNSNSIGFRVSAWPRRQQQKYRSNKQNAMRIKSPLRLYCLESRNIETKPRASTRNKGEEGGGGGGGGGVWWWIPSGNIVAGLEQHRTASLTYTPLHTYFTYTPLLYVYTYTRTEVRTYVISESERPIDAASQLPGQSNLS